ncbi:MAG TPA: ribosome small subunit-dependent GTPase A [Microthrixaceae bacterium]|nr:ribosome small subunit-dependent GTPase A [Microthrixaceae bacterium]
MSDPLDVLPPGWNAHWAQEWEQQETSGWIPVRVVRIDKGGITVARKPGDEQLVIAAKSARRVVVGDICALDDSAGRIELILPRSTVFERRSPGVSRDQLQLRSRPLAANMDSVFVLQPLDPGFNPGRLARELVLAWESGAQPIVLLTKADLVEPSERERQREAAQRFAPGARVRCVSVADDKGLAELDGLHDSGSMIALLGSSGAGKSTLVNALAGHPVQLVAEVREGDRRGRHTTTAGQIIELGNGALIIDTPGIRGVGLWSADNGFEKAFADLEPFVQKCRFDDCSHTNEPGCGLLEAVEAGKIGADRVQIWQSLASELDQLEDGLETREREERHQRNQRSRRKAKRRDPEATTSSGRSYSTEEDFGDDLDDD